MSSNKRCALFDNKRILIWGYGREGKTTEVFLKNYCSPAKIDILEGKREEFNLDDYDYVFKSPGIVCEEEDERITSETEVFLELFGRQTIGITGTKGKSTTSSLLYTALNKVRGNAILLGNIGDPCLNYFEDINDDTIIVFEMSCHQLAHVKVSPHIGVFLNLFEEHLDYYKTFDRYFKAKANVAAYQNADDIFLKGDNVPDITTKAETITVDSSKEYDYKLNILGKHNCYNAEFARIIACDIYNLDEQKVLEAMAEFTGLPHRLQFVGQKDGVDYYDDSISTIPEAAIGALGAIENSGTILIGGMDRGIDYKILVEYIKLHSEYNYVFMYESGKRVYDDVADYTYCYIATDLKEAYEKAKAVTPKGKAVLLSPAAASYGYFKNFEERGDCFKEMVLNEK